MTLLEMRNFLKFCPNSSKNLMPGLKLDLMPGLKLDILNIMPMLAHQYIPS